MADTEDYEEGGAMAAHKTTHEDGGSDEISVLGLSGLLADGQTPLAHKTSHQDGGADEISVAALSGVLADDQHIIDSEAVSAMGTKANSNPLNHDRFADSEALAAAVQAGAITDGITKAPTHDAVYDLGVTLLAHKTRHQDGGADEISVTGLSGTLADDQHVIDAEVQAIKLDDFTAPDNNTDLNVSTSTHGLAPKGTAGTTQFWRQDWTLATPAGGAKPVRRILFPAACFETRIAAGWAAFVQTQGTNYDYGELDFDKDTDEKAIAPPFKIDDYDGGNIIITIAWKANATSGNVAWVASFAGIADGEPFDAATTDNAFAADTISDVAEDINITTLTVDPAELAADDTVLMKIYRDVSADNLAVDAKLLYAMFEYTEA